MKIKREATKKLGARYWVLGARYWVLVLGAGLGRRRHAACPPIPGHRLILSDFRISAWTFDFLWQAGAQSKHGWVLGARYWVLGSGRWSWVLDVMLSSRSMGGYLVLGTGRWVLVARQLVFGIWAFRYRSGW